MPPTVSICLPVFNGEQHLGEAIESVLNQSFQDYELIVVDDYSTDESRSVMDKYARKDHRIKCYANTERQGLFANYNLCLQHSTGYVIKPFAQDDILHPDNLEWCVNALQSDQRTALVATARNWIDETGGDVSDIYRSPSSGDFFDSTGPIPGIDVVRHSLVPVINFIGEPSCVAFPRKHIADGFDPGFHHLGDLDYWLRILLNGDFTYTNEELCSFRRHRKSQTHVNLSELRVATDLIRIGRNFRSVLIASGLSEREFMRAALKLISEQLYFLTRSDEGDFSALRTDRGQGAPDEGLYLQRARRLLSTLSAEELRDLTSYALELLVEEDKLHDKRQPRQGARAKGNEALIARYESRLRRALDDPFWKATAPLRIANRYLTGSTACPQVGHDEPPQRALLAEQESYIQFLKSQICRVKSSRSWALGRFLKEPDFRLGSHLAGRLLGRRTLHREIRELNRRAKGKHVDPRVSWQPVDSLIEEVIYDFKSPRRTTQLSADTGAATFEGGRDVHSFEEQEPQISVLLSVERAEPTHILEALARQSVAPEAFEVIMVDATDTPDLVPATRRFMQGRENQLRLRAFRCVPGGRALASNIQLRMASSDLIVFLAGDFVPPPAFVESHIEFHRRHTNATVAGVGGSAFPPELRDTHLRRWLDDSGNLYGYRMTDEFVDLPPNFFYVGNASVKKSLVFQAGLFDEDFPYDAYEDYEIGLRLRQLGVQFTYVPSTVCMHHHPITLRERLGTMDKAAESAVVLDGKHAGVKPWHKLLHTPALVHGFKAAGNAMRYCLSGQPEHLGGFFEKLMEAQFAHSYKKYLRKRLQLRNAD